MSDDQADDYEDPNDAYDIVPMPVEPHGPQGWFTVLRNGIVDRHFPSKAAAEQYATHPKMRAEARARRVMGQKV